jgi:hypothetical protein
MCGPLNQRQIPASAKWVLHLDAEALGQTVFGRLVYGAVRTQHQNKLDAITLFLGSDPTTDIYGLTLYGPDSNEANAVALIHGRFDREKLLSLLALNPDYAESAHGETTLYHWQEKMRGKPQTGTFAAVDLIVISQSQDAVKAALDVLAGQSQPLAEDAGSSLAILTEWADGAFIAAAADGLSDLAAGNEHAAVLKNSQMMSIVADEVDGQMRLFVHLEGKSDQAAQQIEQVARGMLAFAALKVQHDQELSALFEAIQLTRAERQIVMSFEYPSAELYEFAKSLGSAGYFKFVPAQVTK